MESRISARAGFFLVLVVTATTYILVLSRLAHGEFEWLHVYHQRLANAFLHGSLSLIDTTPSTHDLSEYQGKLFLYWGPAPAALMVPFVALFGTRWPPYFASASLGLLGTCLAYLSLFSSRRWHGLSPSRCALLALTYGIGSPAFPLAMRGNVWFVSQLCGVLFLFLGVICSCQSSRGRLLLGAAAACIGIACLSRISMLGSWAWLLAVLLGVGRSSNNDKEPPIQRAYAWVLVPFTLFAAVWLSYNALRFGNLLETGVTYHYPDSRFRGEIAQYGVLNLHYLCRNFYYHFLSYPFLSREDPQLGGSLFLLTPVYFGAFWAFRERTMRRLAVALLLAAVLVALPGLLVCGTGWVQVGPRYTVDYAPFLLLLTALGVRHWPFWLLAILSLASIAQYIYATLWLL